MMLLDIKVVSEMVRGRADPVFLAAMDRYDIEDLSIPSVVVAEVRYGIGRMQNGRRRGNLASAFEAFLGDNFARRVVPFNEACATGYASARMIREPGGRPVGVMGALIGEGRWRTGRRWSRATRLTSTGTGWC